jgi:DUF4097 and DUF4098 domain-containing protein YvlB
MKTLTRTIAAVLAVGVIAPLPAALSKGGNGAVTAKGKCTGHSTSKIKVKPSNGKIEVEFEVDQNRNGVTWNYKLSRAGVKIASGKKVTVAPSGSFTARRLVSNLAGPDTITARATRSNGEVCTARVTL